MFFRCVGAVSSETRRRYGARRDQEDQHHTAKRRIVDAVEQAEADPRSEQHRRRADEIGRDGGGGENAEA
jgi:hypothetical protein